MEAFKNQQPSARPRPNPLTRWRTYCRTFVVTLSLGGSLILLVAWYVGGRLIAPAPREIGSPPAGFPAEPIMIPSDSGEEVAAWYVPADPNGFEPVPATIILLHPIRADRRAMVERARMLYEAGYSVVLVDFQGHGESPGANITAGYRERLDVQGAVRYVRTKHPTHRVGIVGWSLGGAAALLAMPIEIDVLVLESVYPTLAEAVQNRVAMRLGSFSYAVTPLLLCQLPLRIGVTCGEIRPIDHIDQAGCPVLVLAGTDDVHTTVAETERIYAAAAEPKQLSLFQGVGHSDLMDFDRLQYEQVVMPFLDQACRR